MLMNQHHGHSLKRNNTERLSTVLWTLAESIRIINILITPFMPETAQKIWEKLNIVDESDNIKYKDSKNWGIIKPSTQIEKGSNLFNRI